MPSDKPTLVELREDHTPDEERDTWVDERGHVNAICRTCDMPAPCDTSRVLDALDAVLAEVARAEAKPGVDGERKVHTVIIRAAISAHIDHLGGDHA